jgi:chromosome segregation ATPase
MSISAELEKKLHSHISEIVSRGDKPTYELIRSESGSSLNSIKSALDSWKALQETQPSIDSNDDHKIEVDAELKGLVMQQFGEVADTLIRTITQTAQDDANETLVHERTTNSEQLKKMVAEVAEINVYSDAREKDIELLSIEVESLKTTIETQQADIKEKIDQLNKVTSESSTLQREMATLKQDNKNLHNVNAELTTKVVQATAEIQTLNETSSTLKAKNNTLSKEQNQLHAKYTQMLEQLSELKGTTKSDETIKKELRADNEKLREKTDQYVAEIATLKAQMNLNSDKGIKNPE